MGVFLRRPVLGRGTGGRSRRALAWPALAAVLLLVLWDSHQCTDRGGSALALSAAEEGDAAPGRGVRAAAAAVKQALKGGNVTDERTQAPWWRFRRYQEEEARKAKEEEEKARQEERARQEAERAKEEEAHRLAQEKEEQEARRKEEIKQKEEEAVRTKQRQLRRPLNAFEERRLRRQVRSELTGGGSTPGGEDEKRHRDWFKPLRSEVKSQLDDAIKFFSDTMRVPATLLGSAALGMLFLPPFKWAFLKEEQQEPRFVAVWRLYVLLTAFTFCAQLTVVLGTSNAHAQLIALGRSGLALEPTAMDLIMTHMEFEYLTCSLSFFCGVVSFMLATFCRVVAVFRFANSRRMPQEPQLCLAVGGMMLSSLLWWLHLANVRLVEFNDLGAMLSRYLQLILARVRLGEVGVVGSAALALSAISLLSGCRLVVAPLLARRSTAGKD